MQKVKSQASLWVVLAVVGTLSLSCEPADSAIVKRSYSVPRNGLVAEWLLNGTLNDTAGTNNGTAVDYGSGSHTFVSGRKGKVNEALSLYALDSSSNYSDIGFPLNDVAVQSLSGTQSVSASVWFNSSSTSLATSGSGCGPFESQPGYTFFGFALSFNSNYLLAGVGASGFTGDSVSSINQVSDSTWHHAVLVYDTTPATPTLALYLDGVLQSSITTTVSYVSAPASTAGRFVAGVVGYTGLVEQIRLYNRALTASEVSALYHE